MTQASGTTGAGGQDSPAQFLGAVLPGASARGGRIDDPAVRQAIRSACDSARRNGWQAEQLILEVKRLWGASRARGVRRSRPDDQALLESVVSYCIVEFYRNE